MNQAVGWLVARLLRLVDPSKPLGKDLFEAVARLSVSVALEAVALRHSDNGLEVFLAQRGGGESFSGQWHCPGSVFRPEEGRADVLSRISTKEFGVEAVEMRSLGQVFWREERGWFCSLFWLVELRGDPAGRHGCWVPADDLPEDTIPQHRRFIEEAVAAARAS